VGTESLTDKANGQVIDQTWWNLIHAVLSGNLVPRNASRVATDLSGSIGTSALRFLKAFIASGYLGAGDVKWKHSYNSLISIEQGWMIANGSVCNEANYNALHGAGSWDTYIITSPLDGLYLPSLIGKYPVGTQDTTQDGSTGISSVGNVEHQVNLSHRHLHNHKMKHSSQLFLQILLLRGQV